MIEKTMYGKFNKNINSLNVISAVIQWQSEIQK